MPIQLSDLQTFEITDEIRIEELSLGYPIIQINNTHASATIAIHGAHLTHYQPHNQKPVIFTSEAAIYQAGKAIRGGIPVCWPWFGAHPDASLGLSAHGYARTSFWELTSTRSDNDGTYLSFTLPSLNAAALTAQLEFFIGTELKLKLITRNNSDQPQSFSEALHSYFSVGDTTQSQVTGLDGRHYSDSSDESQPPQQQSGPIEFPGEIDRIYNNSKPVTVDDRSNQRQITVTQKNGNSSIIWNPGFTKGASMDDLLNQEITQFICAESGNVKEQSISLSPYSSHTLTLTISTQA